MPNSQLINYQLSASDYWQIFFRLSIALTSGGIIGWERQIRKKPAGLRTHMLVSLGSGLFTEKLGIKPRPYRTAFLVLLKSGKVINHLKNLATER
jgi:hypothetical protein